MLPAIVACLLAFDAAGAAPPETAAPAQAAPAASSAPAAPSSQPVPTPAQQEAARILGVGEGVAVNVDVGVWVPRLTGTARVGAGGTPMALNEQLAVGASAPGVAGELGVFVDRWRFGGIGFATSLDSHQRANAGGTFGTTTITPGDRISGSYSAWMVGAEVGYVVWRPFADEPWPWSDPGANREEATKAMGANGRPLVDMRFLVLGGALAFGYEQTLQNDTAGGQSSFDKTVGGIYGGGGLELNLGIDGRFPLVQDVRIYGYAGIGPSIPDGDVLWMIRVGVAVMFTKNVGLEFGYRLFDFDLQSGPSEVDGGLRGVFGAVTLKF
ncbi:MAG: hypothetical protein U0625_13075 [Phycisphaerales bacterium]